jgi:hypothetical protein
MHTIRGATTGDNPEVSDDIRKVQFNGVAPAPDSDPEKPDALGASDDLGSGLGAPDDLGSGLGAPDDLGSDPGAPYAPHSSDDLIPIDVDDDTQSEEGVPDVRIEETGGMGLTDDDESDIEYDKSTHLSADGTLLSDDTVPPAAETGSDSNDGEYDQNRYFTPEGGAFTPEGREETDSHSVEDAQYVQPPSNLPTDDSLPDTLSTEYDNQSTATNDTGYPSMRTPPGQYDNQSTATNDTGYPSMRSPPGQYDQDTLSRAPSLASQASVHSTLSALSDRSARSFHSSNPQPLGDPLDESLGFRDDNHASRTRLIDEDLNDQSYCEQGTGVRVDQMFESLFK